MGELDEAAAWLAKVTADPMADAVAGAARIVSVSEPAPRGRYQEARLEVRAEAPGLEPQTIALQVVFRRRDWPAVGRVLPALISRTHPGVVEVD